MKSDISGKLIKFGICLLMVFSSFLLYSQSSTKSTKKSNAMSNGLTNSDTIIYVGDPMCSWCYGFSEEVTLLKSYADNSNGEFKLLMGGLRPDGTETMNDLAGFLKGHWEHVNKQTGQPFNYAILENKQFVYNTEPACRAVFIVRRLYPDVELTFFKKVQHAFYEKNKATNELNTYVEILNELGLETGEFERLFNDPSSKVDLYQEFKYVSSIGVRGFPSVLLKRGDQVYLLSNGYTTFKNLEKAIERALTQ